MLVKTFKWSLFDLDQTDVTSIFDFIGRVSLTGGEAVDNKKKIHCDEAPFL